MPWKKILSHVAANAELRFDLLKHVLETRLGRDRPINIVAHNSFGTQSYLNVQGRVLKQSGLPFSDEKETIWKNMLQTYQRFETDEVPGALLRAHYEDVTVEMVTDEEGYFAVQLPVEDLPAQMWHDVHVSLVDAGEHRRYSGPGVDDVSAIARVIVPPPDAAFGVISDLDDTVIKTNAASFIKMAWTTFMNSSSTLLPFKGVAAFYRALHAGAGAVNPIFYLSSSPWNLYDLLVDFLEINDVPAGPLLLRDLGIDKDKFISTGHFAHKLSEIDRIFDTYPNLSFILIGDSGQHDPEIFEQVVEQHPHRVLAVYIRDVSQDYRDEEVRQAADRIRKHGIDMLLVRDSREAAEHAADRGYIDLQSLQEIESEYALDSALPDQVEIGLTTESRKIA